MNTDQKRLNMLPWIHRIIVVVVCMVAVILEIINLLFLKFESKIFDVVLIVLIACCFADICIVSMHSALTDGQTGMANDDAVIIFALRLFFKKQLGKYIVASINLKNYNLINKLLGSKGGDIGLEQYGKALNRFIKKGEKAARLGGDTFIVLIKEERLNEFLNFVSEVKLNIDVDGIVHKSKIAARCGLYSLKYNDGVGSVFNYPTIAVNFAKAIKKDVVWYDENMAEMMYREKEIASRFKDAIAKKEFKVYYQPKVDISTNKLHGCEALVRWERDGTIIPPGEFIPALEHSDLIGKLDHYVLNQVCNDILKWQKDGLECVRVSTNFSKSNLKDPDFAKKVLNIIESNNVDKSLLEIELTESENYGDYESLNYFLAIMKNHNISTAIDDFGVGYSSLELLKNLNIDVVKVDKRFIDNIEDNEGKNANTTLVKHILNTCIELRKEVVCEGVESLEQQKILKTMNCRTIQGYLYDKPLVCEDFEKRLKQPVYTEQ